jgi:putative copper resistance protein D
MPWSLRVFILWLHLLGVVVWIGGLLFQVLVVLPSFQHMPVSAEWLQLRVRLERYCRRILWPAVGVVLLTGLYNVMNVWYATALAGGRVPTPFVRLLSLKLLLVVLMLVLQGIQRLVVQPRTVAVLARLPSEPTEHSGQLRFLERYSSLLHLLTVGAAVVVMLLGLLLHG